MCKKNKHDAYVKKFYDKWGDKKEVVGTYIDSKTDIEILCLECNKSYRKNSYEAVRYECKICYENNRVNNFANAKTQPIQST